VGDNPNESAETKLIWCPYTDNEIPIAEATEEHIIPLSLGGHDALTIPVDGRKNSTVGSEIDGGVANEFLIARQRVKHGVRGHRRKVPAPRTRATEEGTGRPLVLNWGKRLEIYDPRERRVRTGVKFKTNFSIDVDVRLRFLAKCFLSAGYLVYGDLFRRAVEHGEPRLAMNKPPREFSKAEGASFRTRILGWYHGDLQDPKQAEMFALQNALSSLEGSFLVFTPGPANLGIFGGVLGEYLGMLNVPADTTDFPRTGHHDLGHVIVVANGKVHRGSFRVLIQQFMRFCESTPPGTFSAGRPAPDAG
jgi:hypothetical protein